MEDSILFKVDQNNIAWLSLNRPQVHNAFNQEMIDLMLTHLRKLLENQTIRVLVIEGQGDSFCDGADLSWMKGDSQISESQSYEEARTLALMLYQLDSLPFPVICYAHGAVMGGGIGILACADIVLSDPNTRFSFPEVRLGLVPSIISPYVLRTIGRSQARRFFLTGEAFDTPQAQAMGLIHSIVDLKNKADDINKVIHHLLSGSPNAILQSKRLIRQISGDVSEDLRLKTIELIGNIRLSQEGQDGIKAFLNKTTPSWTPPDA
jgi:methylglutaconyl-CoA hydratase